MTLEDLNVFVTVAEERSFSRAARKLRRTQPAVSQAIRRLEDSSGERLIDRSQRDGTLTDAGAVLLDYARHLLRLSEEAVSALQDLRDTRRGRVLIGTNEGGVHAVLPVIARFREAHPGIQVDVRRVHARLLPQEVLLRTVDFGVLTYPPADRELLSVTISQDDLVLLMRPDHPLARRPQVSMEEMGRQAVIAHNDPSPARDRVLRLYEERQAELNIRMSLPSLDGIKRAVEMGLGVALLPRRCALTELKRGELVAVTVTEFSERKQVRLIYRRQGDLSHAAQAFLDLARQQKNATS